MMQKSNLVSVSWLVDNLHNPRVKLLDASFYLPNSGRDARALFVQEHIEGAAFFDVDQVCDPASPLPHMLPRKEHFVKAIESLGICDGDIIVVYDQHGIFSAPRCWWMLRLFGQREVYVLNGGLPAWKAAGKAVSHSPSIALKGKFTATLHPGAVMTKEQVLALIQGSDYQILDARPAARFEGQTPEARPDLRSGHIPKARNLPFSDLLSRGQMKELPELERIFSAKGLDKDRPVTNSCGSGITACILALAQEEVGFKDIRVYDGSWSEWGREGDTPIETGTESWN